MRGWRYERVLFYVCGGMVFYVLLFVVPVWMYSDIAGKIAGAFAKGKKNTAIPEKLGDLDAKKYTNLFINRVGRIAAVTCDEWDLMIIYYVDGIKKDYTELSSTVVASNGGKLFDKRIALTPDPDGFVLSGRNQDGIFNKIFIRNNELVKSPKDVYPIRLKYPGIDDLKLEYRPDKTLEVIVQNESEGYGGYRYVINLRNAKLIAFEKLSLKEAEKIFAKPEKSP